MEETISTLVEKVSILYQRYGIKSVTMDDVARELGISKKTLYQLINDKDELVKKVLEFDAEKKRKEFIKIFNKQNNAIEELLEINKYVVKILSEHSPTIDYDLKKYYPSLHLEMMKIKGKYMFNSLLKNLEKGKKEGLYRENMNESIIAKSYMLKTESCTHSNYFDQKDFSTTEFINETFEYHIRGIANEKGLQLFNKIKNTNN